MAVAENVYRVVQNLSEASASEVLDFAEFLEARENGGKKVSSIDRDKAWKKLIDSVKAYEEDDFPSLEEIRAGQGEDAPREPL